MENEGKVTYRSRKEMKANARKVVKAHWLMLVLVCLLSVFFGTEFGYIKTHAQNTYNFVTGQEIELGIGSFKNNSDSTRNAVLNDLADDNVDAGREKSQEQLKEYEEEGFSKTITGRKSGIFAGIANSISSGHLYLVIFDAIESIMHSSKVSSIILIILSTLVTVAVWVFIKNMCQVMIRRVFLESRTYEIVPASHMLYPKFVHRWFRTSITLLVATVYEVLWALTIIGYPIKHYAYLMVPYIMAENPNYKANEAVTLSRKMMYGHKWEAFKMDLSFIGWHLLGIATFGIAEALWGVPYKVASFTEFYTDMRESAKNNDIEGAERLNDDYLYEIADEDLLRETYIDTEVQKFYIDTHRVELPPARAFFARNFGLWTGTLAEKKAYDDVDNRRQQIVENRAVIKQKIYPQRLNPLWDMKIDPVISKIKAVRTYTIWTVIAAFFIFAFVGWLWEVGIHLVQDGVFVNRGTMHGPWLPIYGGGVALITVLLARFRSKPPVELVSIVVLCGFVEYFTSYYLEVTKGMRWWDYTGYFLNLNGRICGEGLMVFAIGGMAAVYLALPVLDAMLSRVNSKILIPVCIVLLIAYGADMVYSHYVPNAGAGITDYSAYEQTGYIEMMVPDGPVQEIA